MRLKLLMKISILILLSIFLLSCEEENNSKFTVIKEKSDIKLTKLTNKKIINNEWTTHGELFSYGNILTFKNDNTYTEEFLGEGCGVLNSGTYSLSEDIVTLIGKNNPECPSEDLDEKRNCKINKESKDPFFSKSIICGKNLYFGEKKPIGTIILINDIESVIIETIVVSAQTNIKVREKPSLNSKSYKCYFNVDGINVSELTYFPKGRELILIARTSKKEVIDKIEDYWYFAQQDFDWYEHCSTSNKYTSRVWVFGGYLKK